MEARRGCGQATACVPEDQQPTGTALGRAGYRPLNLVPPALCLPRPTEKAAMKTTGDIWALVADGFPAVWVGPVCPP